MDWVFSKQEIPSGEKKDSRIHARESAARRGRACLFLTIPIPRHFAKELGPTIKM